MSKKKSKFQPISNRKHSNNTIVIPGRHKCECAATKHDLINNCINCGRIVCCQEGSGCCWYCGELVCTNEEFEKISNKSNRSEAFLEQLMKTQWNHHWNKEITNEKSLKIVQESFEDDRRRGRRQADERKQRLLEFDRTSARRTRVIDDERDYYETEKRTWTDPKEREALRHRGEELRQKRFEEASARPIRVTLDMATGRVTEDRSRETTEAALALFEEPDWDWRTRDAATTETVDQERRETMSEASLNTEYLSFIDPNRNGKPKYENQSKPSINRRRIQDSELQEIRDDGMCLSMHQPWASLLVTGVKKHEGRSWFTNHRGRLWIAATAKHPSPEQIADCEKFYRDRGVSIDLLPKNYPVGCLLGYVNVIDCLPEEDYLEMYPDGESGSPFVFICENPHELKLKFPIKGKHKIYKLEPHVHSAAKSGIFIDKDHN